MVVDGIPRRKVFGHHPPLDAPFGHVEDRIHNIAFGKLARVAPGIGTLEERSQ